MEKRVDRPKVSICIPAYNNVEEVRRLLASAVSQTLQDMEIILTDDSTNGEIEGLVKNIREGKEKGIPFSLDIMQRFRYVHNPVPLGHIFNWNKALELANGEYIKIMFSDDWFTYPDSLEKMADMLDGAPEASLAFCGTRQVSGSRVYERAADTDYLESLKADYRTLFLGNKIGAPSATLFRACGAFFDERSNWASDMFLYFEILSKNPEFVSTGEPLISIGVHEEQYTGMFTEKDIRKYQDRLLMYHKYGLRESEACRKEMLRLSVMYGQGWKRARECGAAFAEYAAQRITWFWHNTILGYWNGALHKLGIGK